MELVGGLNAQIFNTVNAFAPLKKPEVGGGEALAGSPQDTPGDLLQGFGNVLQEQMANINHLQAKADSAVQTYATGGQIELHNVILAVDKAEMSLQLAVQVRNKLLQAYQELSHMQV